MKKFTIKIQLFSLLLLPFLTATANADLVADFDFETRTINGTMSASPDVAAFSGVTVGDFTENLTGGTAEAEFGFQDNGLIPANVNGLSARSLNSGPSNPFWEFTVTPDSGNSLSFQTLVLDAGVADAISGNTAWDYRVSSSVDNFDTNLGTFFGPFTSGSLATATGLSVNLSSLADQTGAVTFRITPDRIVGTSGGTGQRAGFIDNVQLNATVTVSVPEPGSLALLGSGLLGLALRRRRS